MKRSTSTILSLVAATLLASSAAHAEIFPTNQYLNLRCGTSNFIEISTSATSLDFASQADEEKLESLLERDGYFIVKGNSSIIITGDGKSYDRNNNFADFFDLIDSTGVRKTYVYQPMTEDGIFGSDILPSITINIKAGESVNLSDFILSQNSALEMLPNVNRGDYTKILETFLVHDDGVTSSSYADLGKISATGTSYEGQGRRYSFTATEDGKGGTIRFQYLIRQRMMPIDPDTKCEPSTSPSDYQKLTIHIEAAETEETPEPEAPSGTETAQFLFRYPINGVK